MNMSGNFPLFNNQIGLTKEDLYQYILLFPHHEVLFSKSIAPLHSYHRYRDGLMLKCTWTTLKDVSFLSSQKEKHASSIQELVDEGFVTLKKASIFYFSDVNSSSSPQTYQAFQQLLEKKQRTLPKVEYENLEFPTYIPTIISDALFEQLVQQNQNVIEFKQFLAKRETNKNESL